MRILSQEGINEKWDIPYEIAVVSYSKYMEGRYRIYAQGTFAGINPNENSIQIAEYSTESKAKKAIEILHDAYMAHIMYKAMPEQQKPLLIATTSDEEQRRLYGVFKFPSENELED